LDALAARLACAGCYVLDTALIAQGRKAARGKKVGAMIEADIAFHMSIYRAANNPLIEQSAQLHWQHIRRAMGAVLQSTKLRETVWDEHEEIARAIAAKDVHRAESLMRAHGEQASHNLETHLAQTLSASAA
jgi:DNA-binding GntR family transcriptional regulator